MSSDAGRPGAGGVWSRLRAGGREATSLKVPTLHAGVTCPAGPVRFAIGENGEARLLLPLRKGETLRGFADAPSLRIRISTYVTKGRGARFLDITCTARDLEAVFAEVVDEVVSRVSAGERCPAAARSTIEEFRTLLLRTSGSGVPASAVVGLVAELLVLNRLLDRSQGAWRAWRGPKGERHDFRSAGVALEVKATTRAGNSVITVSSMEQMEPPAGGTLHILHITAEQAPGGLLSIAALGRAALAKADQPDAVRQLISAAGCESLDSEQWNRAALHLESEQLYAVRAGFPRLSPSMLKEGSLPAGVGRLKYEIDLSAAASFACSASQAARLEAELAGCA
ncbi:MAG: PD-(D/E)XK motif protein [Bryobacterales bacterium]|nr:PD-(D/E)XK motif protein [Bryobacterales bacterium]